MTVNAVTHNLTNLFILHLSVGNGLIVDGGMRNVIAAYNTANSTQFVLWDHGYNADGLRDQHGNFTGTNYSIPSDDTTPWGLCLIWTSQDPEYVATRTAMMSNHQVIAFKSCFPASDIGDANTLQQYKTWYLAMRDFFDAHPEKLFIVMTTPPLHRLATNPTAAANARAFANWLSSSTYLSGHPNVRCFNLFDYLAKADDGTPTANMLRFEYELDDGSDDSHPNAQANAIVGPILAQFLCNAAREY
ncbi:MAG: hypothetical protein BWY76_02116 [bacterium ADurb.Bin429]|nr:MAG: hypothetical protein BWY76_02116 [bacterium ADurb.Bin429]